MYTYAHAIKNSYKYAGTLSKLNIQYFNPMDDKTNKKDNGEHFMTSIAIKLPAHLKATLTHYTPTIEEFHVGFEYQRMNGDRWEDAVMNANDFNSSNNSHGDENEFDGINEKLRDVRVKCLSRECNESCGLIVDIIDLGQDTNENELGIYKNEVNLAGSLYGAFYIDPTVHNANIELFDTFFMIKNKSEFKRLIQQMGIL